MGWGTSVTKQSQGCDSTAIVETAMTVAVVNRVVQRRLAEQDLLLLWLICADSLQVECGVECDMEQSVQQHQREAKCGEESAATHLSDCPRLPAAGSRGGMDSCGQAGGDWVMHCLPRRARPVQGAAASPTYLLTR